MKQNTNAQLCKNEYQRFVDKSNKMKIIGYQNKDKIRNLKRQARQTKKLRETQTRKTRHASNKQEEI